MCRGWLSSSIIAGLTMTVCPGALAVQPPARSDLGSLREVILQTAEQPPEPQAALRASRDRLASSLRQLEEFLAGGDGRAQGDWCERLVLPALQSEVERSHLDAGALESLADRFLENQPGLELPAFVAVRRALRGYIAARKYAAAESPPDLFRRRLLELAECIERLEAAPAEADAHRAGCLTAWIEPLGDGGAALANAVRTRYGGSNGFTQASGRLLNVLLGRSVEEQTFIAQTVLGSYTEGLAFTRAQILFGVVPAQDRGALEVRLQGHVTCPSNIAERRRVSVQSAALTEISAHKQVNINDLGLHLAPAAASCATSVEIQDVAAGSRILERIAWRRANRMVSEAEQIASQRAQLEVSAKLDAQANTALDGANATFCQKIRAPLIRFNALPATFQFYSDESHLRLSLSQRNESQLVAAGPAPQLSQSYDVAGCVHESLINNLSESLLGGRTIEDETWLEMMHLLLGTPPRALWVHDRAERWSVTFAKEQPVLAHFASDRIGFTLRFARITRGTQPLDRAIEIEATFIPQITRDGPHLMRDGKLTVRFTGPLAPPEDPSLLAFLTRKFGAVFPPEITFAGITPPTGGTIGRLRQLQTAEFRSAAGWLTLAYELEPE